MWLFGSLQNTQLNLLIHTAYSSEIFLPQIPDTLSSHVLHPASRASRALSFRRTNYTYPLDEFGQVYLLHCTSGILGKCNIHNTKSKAVYGPFPTEVEGTAPGLVAGCEAGLTLRVRHHLEKGHNSYVDAWLLAKAQVQKVDDGTRLVELAVAGSDAVLTGWVRHHLEWGHNSYVDAWPLAKAQV